MSQMKNDVTFYSLLHSGLFYRNELLYKSKSKMQSAALMTQRTQDSELNTLANELFLTPRKILRHKHYNNISFQS